MRNPLKLVQSLNTPTAKKRTQPMKSRRQRRQAERESVAQRSRAERAHSAKVNEQK
jgi:hypothetical protein